MNDHICDHKGDEVMGIEITPVRCIERELTEVNKS